MRKTTLIILVFLIFGSISYGQFTAMLPSMVSSPNENVAMDMNVTGLNTNNIISIQFYIQIDPAALTFQNITNFQQSGLMVGFINGNTITMVWTGASPKNFPDGRLLTLNFKYNGLTSPVSFIPLNCEVLKLVGGIPVVLTGTFTNGSVSPFPGNQAKAKLDSLLNVPPGTTTVHLKYGGFNGNVGSITQRISYDPSKLTFIEVTGVGNLAVGFDVNLTAGILTITWTSGVGKDINYPASMFNINFNYINSSSTNVNFSVGCVILTTTPPTNIPVSYTNGLVSPALCPWIPVPNQQFNMSVIAKLYISNVLTTNPSDAIGAFVGAECRGIGYPDPALNGIIFLTITSDVQTGETVTFKAWKSATCEECFVAETMPFANQSEVGTVGSPFEFHCGMVQLCTTFGAGYTWFSVNVNPGSMALNSLFSNLTPCENDRIIGQQSFATYFGTQWVGSLSAIDPKAMYKMKLCTQQSWCKQGSPVSIEPITIASGYPWIGYLPQSDLPINTALAGLVPAAVSNDRFNGQSSFATSTGTQWVGTLSTLQKGKGYIIHLANSSVLTYPTGMDNPGITIEDPPVVLSSPTGDNPVISLRYNMQLISTIILPDGSTSTNSGDVVYAYVGDELRGMANPVSDLNGRLFLSVGSDVESGEEVT
ncbi:MAG: hypothetical protein NT004_09710, partial [Bacteroidetes bacterium]|nr:hypothetical protein [Bacteroidota bacterium]